MHEAMGCSPTECVLLSRQSQQCHTAASRQKRVQAEHQLGIDAIHEEAHRLCLLKGRFRRTSAGCSDAAEG